MKIVVPGGSGSLGTLLTNHWLQAGHDVVILSRSGRARAGRGVKWDGTNLGPWVEELEGADVIVNMAGRIINCPCTDKNMKEIYWSRVDSTRILNVAVTQCKNPPKIWLNSSTATIYAHTTEGPPNTESSGVIGGFEEGAPLYWVYSVNVAKAWEETFFATATPQTRKVALRSSFVVETEPGGPFDTFYAGALLGMGGRMGSGQQWTSWIHEDDFKRIVDFIIEKKELTGAVNVCAPNPVSQVEFMATLREKAGICYAIPLPEFAVKLATFMNRSDSEIALKSRRVIPELLLQAGYKFVHPTWDSAAVAAVQTWKAKGYARSFWGNVFHLVGDVLSRWCGETGGVSSRK